MAIFEMVLEVMGLQAGEELALNGSIKRQRGVYFLMRVGQNGNPGYTT
jgi:hypothetical protein